jgi:tRNA (guanine-N7-)-methyltransferase
MEDGMSDDARLPAPAHIRTFKRRASRVTAGQQRALDALADRFVIGAHIEDVTAVFDRPGPVVLEIGFGMGETTAAMASADPATNIVAVDVHTPGVGALLAELRDRGLANVRLVSDDAVPVLRDRVPDAALAGIRVFFPDPWPKTRHHKRRLIGRTFADLAATKLAAGGLLHCATDWPAYAEWMVEVLGGDERFDVEVLSERPPWRPVTRFERQGLAKGHAVTDVLARRR